MAVLWCKWAENYIRKSRIAATDELSEHAANILNFEEVVRELQCLQLT